MTIVAGDVLACRTEDELIECLSKGNSRVYDPYVLLRTAEAFRGIDRIALPGDIRNLLETVYRDREEAAGLLQVCKQILEGRKEKLRNLAMAAEAEVRSLPTQTDDESKTRYSDYPTADILIVRSVEENRGDSARVTLPDGTVLNVTARDRSMDTIRALHRWTAKVPRFWLPKSASKSPEWLKCSFHVTPFVVIMDGNLKISALYDDSGAETGLCYREDIGIWREDGSGTPLSTFDTRTNADYDFENEDW